MTLTEKGDLRAASTLCRMTRETRTEEAVVGGGKALHARVYSITGVWDRS